jgi:hypothetical protein
VGHKLLGPAKAQGGEHELECVVATNIRLLAARRLRLIRCQHQAADWVMGRLAWERAHWKGQGLRPRKLRS